MISRTLLLSLLLLNTTQATQLRQRTQEDSVVCEIVINDVLTLDDEREETHCRIGNHLYPITLPSHIPQDSLPITVRITNATDDGERLHIGSDATYTTNGGRSSSASASVARQAMGSRSLMVVRVSTTDRSPTQSGAVMQNTILNPSGINVMTQMGACSNGDLTLHSRGLREIRLSKSISSYANPSELVNEASDILSSQLGGNLPDHAMFCLPAGTNGNPWIATANGNSWRSWYNDQWCTSLSAGMHELGHNINAVHANTAGGGKLGDKSGYMSLSDSKSDYPRRCYNGYNTWKLGWHASNRLTTFPDAGPRRVTLDAFATVAATGGTVAINVADQFYLVYNKKVGHNDGTGAPYGDKVTITSVVDGNTRSIAQLEVGDEFRSGILRIVACASAHSGNGVVLSIANNEDYCTGPVPEYVAPPPTQAPVSLEVDTAQDEDEGQCTGGSMCRGGK